MDSAVDICLENKIAFDYKYLVADTDPVKGGVTKAVS